MMNTGFSIFVFRFESTIADRQSAELLLVLGGIDYFVVVMYMIGIMVPGFYFKRSVRSSEDYFLGDTMMPFWAIGMSIPRHLSAR
jgi:hypothetical protein